MNIKNTFTAGLAMAVLAPAALAQNDECSTATTLAIDTPTAYDTATATASLELWPCALNGGPDLWYQITPSAAGVDIRIETCGSSYDTALELFSGACGTLLSEICNDDDCGLQSGIDFTTTGTAPLFVRVAGYNGATGAGTITYSEPSPPVPPPALSIDATMPGTFMDISTTGTALFMADDGEEDVFTTIANPILTGGAVRVGANGGIQMASSFDGLSFANGNLPAVGAFNETQALLPFWDDINVSDGTAGDVYYQETGGMLIIQWQDASFYEFGGAGPGTNTSLDTVTFQVQIVGGAGPVVARYIYQSVDSVRADGGASATIGAQTGGDGFTPPVPSVEFSFDTPGAVMNGDVLTILAGPGGTGDIGMNYCMANANSTGVAAAISAAGSTSVAANDVTLTASNLPTNAFGFFLASTVQGFVPNPAGSDGNLCLGGAIGRYVGPGQIQNAGSAGEFSLAIDLTDIPQPTGGVPATAGATWNFQAWNRDAVGGMATSNFTDGLEITFTN